MICLIVYLDMNKTKFIINSGFLGKHSIFKFEIGSHLFSLMSEREKIRVSKFFRASMLFSCNVSAKSHDWKPGLFCFGIFSLLIACRLTPVSFVDVVIGRGRGQMKGHHSKIQRRSQQHQPWAKSSPKTNEKNERVHYCCSSAALPEC